MALLIRGARPQEVSKYGQTPLEMVRDEKHREELEIKSEQMNRLIKQQMRIFNVKIPYEKKRVVFEKKFLTYKVVPPVKHSLDENFLDVADMVRRLGLNELDTNKETHKIIHNPRKVCMYNVCEC